MEVKVKGENRIEEMKLKVMLEYESERGRAKAYWFEGSDGVAMAESRDWKLESGSFDQRPPRKENFQVQRKVI